MKVQIFLFEDYCFVEDEFFMNDMQLEYFWCKLIVWKQELFDQFVEMLEGLQESVCNVFDLVDCVFEEIDCLLELCMCDWQCKLVSKIDLVLCCIEIGDYGYCEMMGELISFKWLDVCLIVIMMLEVQEKYEWCECVYCDD